MTLITIREFGTLTTSSGVSSLDRATIPALDFDWLAQLTSTDGTRSRLLRMEGPRALKVQNYVGVIRTPTGLDIEVLPKRCHSAEDPRAIRRLLLRMIAASHGIPPQVADVADIQILDQPFTEWMALTFVRLAADVVRRGLRRDYLRVEGRERYLRGQLDLPRQLRAGPAAALDFHVRHDVFSLDGPENRLIRAAVDRVARNTRVALTWRLARELTILLAEIPASRTIQLDLERWRDDRLMAHYTPIRGVCELILTGRTPFAVAGEHAAESMLFPMERLFEDCVERAIRKRLPPGYMLQPQPRSHTLCRYAGRDWFELKPDFVVRGSGRAWILDAKWKLLNSDAKARFGVSQADLYQLNAYGQTYLGGHGDLFLVYPRTPDFPDIGAVFEMAPGLRVHVLPIDIEAETFDLGAMLSAR